MPDLPNATSTPSMLTGDSRITSDIITQQTQGSQHIQTEHMSAAKKWIIGVFTLGIGAIVIAVKEHNADLKAAQLANDILQLRNTLGGLKEGTAYDITLRMASQLVRVEQREDNTLFATIDGTIVTIPFTARELKEKLEDDIASNVTFYGAEISQCILQNTDADFDIQGERCRSLSLRVLESTTGLKAAEISSVSTAMLRTLAEAVCRGVLQDPHDIHRLLDTIGNPSRINSEDCLYLHDKLEKALAQDAAQVDAKVDLTRICASIRRQTHAQDKMCTKARDVHDFIADILYSSQTWVHDKTIDQPGERLRHTFLEHAPTLMTIAAQPELLATIDPDIVPLIRAQLKELESVLPKGIFSQASLPHLTEAIKSLDASKFAQLESMIDDNLNSLRQEISKQITDTFAHMMEETAQAVDETTPQEKTLDDLLKSSGIDIKSDGYGLFMRNVLSVYFLNLSPIDMRAVMASGIRYATAQSSEGEKLGALLKGTGPIMQKMLQGFNVEGMEPVFREALQDMKSRLSPIHPEIIQSHLLEMVESSHGKIQKIEVTRSLGAASVGQALLCKIYSTDHPEGEECVIKILRPDVQNRAAREKGIFEEEASKISGMDITFAGQLSRIMDEMDLTVEAKNVRAGAVYDQSGTRASVASMKLQPLVAPTANTMVLEKAPGQTLDSYVDDVRHTMESVIQQFAVRDDAGNIITENGKIKFRRDSLQNTVQAMGTMGTLYREVRRRHDLLISMSTSWVTEGIFGAGFYHGDLHAGNIMVDSQKLTLIDFGNATTLTGDQQTHVTLMTTAAACKDAIYFLKGYEQLLSPEGVKRYQEKKAGLTVELNKVFALGTPNDTGKRIAVALSMMQKQGLEVPAPIFNFSQCQLRLAASIDAVNELLQGIDSLMRDLGCKDAGGTDPVTVCFQQMALGHDDWTVSQNLASVFGDVTGNFAEYAEKYVNSSLDRLEEPDCELNPYIADQPPLQTARDAVIAAKASGDAAALEHAKDDFRKCFQEKLPYIVEGLRSTVVDLLQHRAPETFIDCMGTVISEHLKTAVSRLGMRALFHFRKELDGLA